MSNSRWISARRLSSVGALCTILACGSRSQTKPGANYEPSPLAQAAIAAAQPSGPAVPNSIWVRNPAETAQDNRPMTVSRFFARGEIAACPQAVVEGNAVETQCDVKTRWDDGSVQHSLVTFFASVPAGGRLKVDFVNQAQTDATGLAKQEMFDFAGGKWGAAIAAGANVVDDSEPVFTNAKDILAAWNGTPSDTSVRYWLRGPLVTQVIVEDKSAQTPFDFGWYTALGVVRNSVDITRTATEFTVYPDYAREIAGWTLPLQVYSNGEAMKICEVQGLKAVICPDGRGADGTKARVHRTFIDVSPDAGWRKSTEQRQKSLHPVFVLTFYRGWAGVKVEAIVENTWTQRLQNQVYNMRLMKDDPFVEAGPVEKVMQAAGTRWRRVFWSGAEPQPVSIDYNFPYLIHSRSLPSYDLARKVTEKGITDEWSQYQQAMATEDFMGGAQWLRYFPAPGGRPDIAYIPRWYLRYLYTFDPRLEEVMLGNAEAVAHIPVHYRESMTGRKFCDRSCTSPSPDALGRVLSIDARPTVNAAVNGLTEAKAADRLEYVGASGIKASVPYPQPGGAGYSGWAVDLPHQPGLAYVPYLITGDWYFLEELQFWAAYNATTSSPAADCSFCRNEDWGYTATEVRGRAWALRNLMHAAVMSPAGSAEKEYFTRKLDNFLAILEGAFDIRDGAFYEPCPAGAFNASRTTRWCWGRNVVARNAVNPLLSFDAPAGQSGAGTTLMWNHNDFAKSPPAPVLPQPGAVPVYSGSSEWMIYYNQLVTGAMLELGFKQAAEVHARTLTVRLLHILRDPAATPYLLAVYQTPMIKCTPVLDSRTNLYTCAQGGYFSSWDEIKRGFKEPLVSFPLQHITDAEHGYAIVGRAAASYLYSLSANGLSGKDAWNWLETKIDSKVMDENPMWALVPRELNNFQAAYKDRSSRRPALSAAAKEAKETRPKATRIAEANSLLPEPETKRTKRGKRK